MFVSYFGELVGILYPKALCTDGIGTCPKHLSSFKKIKLERDYTITSLVYISALWYSITLRSFQPNTDIFVK